MLDNFGVMENDWSARFANGCKVFVHNYYCQRRNYLRPEEIKVLQCMGFRPTLKNGKSYLTYKKKNINIDNWTDKNKISSKELLIKEMDKGFIFFNYDFEFVL